MHKAPVHTANGAEDRPTDWNRINWRRTYKRVRNLRRRIFRATREGDYKKVRSLQKLMLRSYSNTRVSVRRVTQLNKGTAGVDTLMPMTCWYASVLLEPCAGKPARTVLRGPGEVTLTRLPDNLSR